MATSIVGVGPLDDYFRDNGDSSDASLTDWKDAMSSGNHSPVSEDSSGEITLVNSNSPMTKNKGWTGPQPCVAGPSSQFFPPTTPRPLNRRISSMDVSPPGAFASPRQLRRREAERFAEKFKYLICSSGLLEKDWVPRLGGEGESLDLDRPGKEDSKAPLADQTTANDPASPSREPNWLEKVEKGLTGRRDLQLAGTVLLLAVGWMVLSLTGAVVLCIVAVVSLSALVYARTRRIVRPTNTTVATTPVVSPASDRHASLMIALTNLLASSRSLDATLDESLRVLPPHAPISHQRLLRTSVHRLCNNMTDHLASATSSLLEIVDRTELAALADMYDIPMAHGLHGRKLSDSDADDSSDDEDASSPSKPAVGRIPSPRKASPPSQSAPNPQAAHLRALAMSTTHSLPGRARPTHSKHLSLTPSRTYRPLLLPRTAMDDRFTQLPNRTPRLSAAASWDQEAFEAARNEGIRADWAEGRIRTRDRSRTRHQRRITEDDEEEVLDGDISGSSDDHRTSLITPDMPALLSPTKAAENKRIYASPPVDSFVPQKRSPLSRDSIVVPASNVDIFAPISSSAGDLVGILPSSKLHDLKLMSTLGIARKPAASDNPKRRSLQSMTYYPSTSTTAEDLTLTRTASLPPPPSDLQALRVASASSSRRPSLASSTGAKSPGLSASTSLPSRLSPVHPAESTSANATVKRTVSLSPLTLPALKAACLGVHLKRRRMACCLLGLNFTGDEDEEYWSDVLELLRDLASAMDNERLALEDALKSAGKGRRRWVSDSTLSDDSTAGVRRATAIAPPWEASSLVFGKADFAPRDSETAKLQQHITELQKGLGEVWERVADANQALGDLEDDGQVGDLRTRWSAVRESLGLLVREWERGREVVSRLDPAPIEDTLLAAPPNSEAVVPTGIMSDTATDLPGFMQAWSDGEATPNSAEDEPEHAQEMTEHLPPPGMDQVFEAVPEARHDPTLGLSRDERIRLTKEARAKGMTLKEMMAGDSGAPRSADSRQEQREAGGMVVKELEGMIGLIRKRRGQAEESKTATPTPAAMAKELPVTMRRVSRERERPKQNDKDVVSRSGDVKQDERFLEDLQRAFVFPKRDVVDEL